VVGGWPHLVLLPGARLSVSESIRASGCGDRASGAFEAGTAASASAKLVLLRIREGVLPVCAQLSERLACRAGHAWHAAFAARWRATRAATAVNDLCIQLSGGSR
jgi:hypothetical protein